MDCSLLSSSVHGTVQARILEWVAIPFSVFCMYLWPITVKKKSKFKVKRNHLKYCSPQFSPHSRPGLIYEESSFSSSRWVLQVWEGQEFLPQTEYQYIENNYYKVLQTSKKMKRIKLSEVKSMSYGLPGWLSGKESACQCRRRRFDPWVGKILSRRKWQPAPVFLPGQSHGLRSLVGCSPRGHRVRHDWVTLLTYLLTYLHCIRH